MKDMCLLLRWATVALFAALSCTTTIQAAKVIALGDSYTAGTGYHVSPFDYDDSFCGEQEDLDGVHYTFSNAGFPFRGCFREINDNPYNRYAEEQNQEFVLLACGGATIDNFVDQIHYMNAKYPEERAINWRGSTIVLTIGLNNLQSIRGDIWYVVLYTQCILLSPLSDCSSNPANKVGNLDAAQAELSDALQLLVSEASEATIRIVGYGELFQRDDKNCKSLGITNGAADLFDNDYYGAWNAALKETVDFAKTNTPVGPIDAVDMEFVDVTSYITVGSCSKDQSLHEMRGFIFGPTNAAFHPSPLGYDKYYQALVDSVALL